MTSAAKGHDGRFPWGECDVTLDAGGKLSARRRKRNRNIGRTGAGGDGQGRTSHDTFQHVTTHESRRTAASPGDRRVTALPMAVAPALRARLSREIEGDVAFDAFTRGRYSTDASIYQVMPLGVVIPRRRDDLVAAIQIAAEDGVSVTLRGAGTSQAGQAVGSGLIVDTSRHLTEISDLDLGARTVRVAPGVVLDRLNAWLSPHGLFFPVDVATSAQATLGGMAGNNSAGARSIRYGMMADNVTGIDAVLADGTPIRCDATTAPRGEQKASDLRSGLIGIYRREAAEIAARFPRVLRNVAGYSLDRLGGESPNLAHLLVGSEGTLAAFTDLTLRLQSIPAHRVLGVCHFPTLHAAMDATRHIVTLAPSAVELTDRAMLSLARDRPEFADRVTRFVTGDPGALLFVEFSGDTADAVREGLSRLVDLMGELGYPNAVVPAPDPGFQREIWSVRKAALNIVMSMRGDRKPVSFIEDCAVPLEHLAAYTDALEEIFARHGTTGTFYAHASVGCLHIRPTLNLKTPDDVRTMRAIVEEAHQLVRRFGGSHSGEHGDGLVRSEFLEPMLGPRLVRAFGEVKQLFDPSRVMNPGKIVDPPRMDDRTLMRYGPEYGARPITPALDWAPWGGLLGAAEMCNNNGACRRRRPGAMCPSFRATADERDVTRGRANSLRLALSGQLGPNALTSQEMHETMDLCLGCKACRRECPTGVDMARMKVEFLHHYHRRHRRSLRDLAVAHLPRYAPIAARIPALFNLRNHSRRLGRWSERWMGISRHRVLPAWRRDAIRGHHTPRDPAVVLFVDTFNRYFEPHNVRAAVAVLESVGLRVAFATPREGGRPVCCGRTYLNAGMVEQARAEGARVVAALAPYMERDVPVIGLEPSCILTLRDELPAVIPGDLTARIGERTMLFEDFVRRHRDRFADAFRPCPQRVVIHPHCHQRAFGAAETTAQALDAVPGLTTTTLDAGCCGMAGAFGYEAEHYDVSMRIGELDLFPAVRAQPPGTIYVAGGTSCRHQIHDGTGKEAVHVARLLEGLLKNSQGRTIR